MSDSKVLDELLASIKMHKHFGENTAHIEIHQNKVINSVLVHGVEVNVNEKPDGIDVELFVRENCKIENPVHLCFGVLPEDGIQRINMNVVIEKNAKASFMAHCTFPNAVNVLHEMNAQITVKENGSYKYFERHVHGDSGGIKVVPKAKIFLEKGAKFKTEFELLKGRVGLMDIDYETVCHENSSLEMKARISASHDDTIKIREAAVLEGAYSKGVLISHIALRDNSKAEIYNDLKAIGDYSKGHVDCKEIVQDNASARAVPVVQVDNPKAHVSHEAAIGSVDSKQLQTLMSRGLSEDDAVDLIIKGLLAS